MPGTALQTGAVKFAGPIVGAVAMTFVFGVAVATSVPASSLAQTSLASPEQETAPREQQGFHSTAGDALAITRDSYSVATPKPIAPVVTGGGNQGGYGGAQCAAGAAKAPPATSFGWVYPGGYRKSDGFGPRAEGNHKGVDMVNPAGTPVHAIADGVVIASSDGGGSGGVYVSIAHNVDGVALCSMYMHFQYGTRTVEVGDIVTVGDVIGLTGDTGNATTAHTHFELYGADGVRFDPMPFMNENAG